MPCHTDREDLIEWFLNHCNRKPYGANHCIGRPNGMPDRLYYLNQGSAYLVVHDEKGKCRILEHLQQGAFWGENGLFKDSAAIGAHWSLRIRSHGSEIAEISYEKFLNLCVLRPELLLLLTKQLSQRLLTNLERLRQHLFWDVTERIVANLSRLACSQEAMTHPKGLQVRSTRQELSQWVGCSRETVGRALKILSLQNVLWSKGKSIVLYQNRSPKRPLSQTKQAPAVTHQVAQCV